MATESPNSWQETSKISELWQLINRQTGRFSTKFACLFLISLHPCSSSLSQRFCYHGRSCPLLAPILVTQLPPSTGNLCSESTQKSGTYKERPTHCPSIARRGSGSWTWAEATTTFRTSCASSRAPPSSAAGILLALRERPAKQLIGGGLCRRSTLP
jgi:hypothetical protein